MSRYGAVTEALEAPLLPAIPGNKGKPSSPSNTGLLRQNIKTIPPFLPGKPIQQ